LIVELVEPCSMTNISFLAVATRHFQLFAGH